MAFSEKVGVQTPLNANTIGTAPTVDKNRIINLQSPHRTRPNRVRQNKRGDTLAFSEKVGVRKPLNAITIGTNPTMSGIEWIWFRV